MDISPRFEAFIRDQALLAPGDRVLLAVSGGVDSVAMATLFRRTGRAFAVAHCNFQLRGAESDADEAFVQDLAAQWGAAFYTRRFDTQAYAESNGLSIQLAARHLRYEWLESVRRQTQAAACATGHTLSDSVETALFNLARGAGLTGMSGIPVRNGAVIRPVLFATRAELEAFMRSEGLAWREDSSNAHTDYSRNFIRHRIVPLLETLNPAFIPTAGRALERFRGAAANLEFLIDHYLQPTTDAGGLLHVDKKKFEHIPNRRQALAFWLKSYGFDEEQARQVDEQWEHTGLRWQSAAGHVLANNRAELLLDTAGRAAAAPEPIQVQPDDLMLRLPDDSRLLCMPTAPAPPYPDGRRAILVDAGRLRYPLRLRHWQPGDVFEPFGMQGRHQKVQDLLTNARVSVLEKQQTWILENGDGAIVWVLGHRLDGRFAVVENTRHAVRFEWQLRRVSKGQKAM